MGSGEGQTERSGELPPGGDPGGAGGCSATAGEALTPLLYWSAQHLQEPRYTCIRKYEKYRYEILSFVNCILL